MSFPTPNQGPLYPQGIQQPGFGQPKPPDRSGGSKVWFILAAVGGGAVLLGLLCCGGVASLFRTPAPSSAARQPFSVADVPVTIEESHVGIEPDYAPGVTRKVVSLAGGQQGGYYDTPGKGGHLYLWLPNGQPAPRSLTCILITGA